MANDFNMTNNTSNNRWDLTYTVDASGTKTKTLETAGTFVDRNIQVSITTNSGTVTPAINNTNLTTYFNTGTSSNYSISLQPTYTNTAGYIAAHTGTAGNGTTSYYSIKTTSRTAGTGSVTLTAGAGSVTLTKGTGDSASSSASSLDLKTTTPTSGVYYTLTATGKGTVTGTGQGTVSTGTGWITSGSTTSNASASASKDSNTATTYGYIMKSVHGNAVTGSTPDSLTRTSGTYLDIEIQPNGYLKIPAGYYPLDRYVFSNKANISGEATAASNYSLNISSISGSSNVSVGTLASGKYPIIANNVSVTGTLTAGTAGWFSSGEATDSDTDNVTVGYIPKATYGGSNGNITILTAGYLPKDEVVASMDTGSHSATSASSSNSTVTPSVALDSTATSTYGFTTTKPSGTTGTNYITVDPNATATAWSVTPRSTATAGYITAGNVDGTAVSNTPTIAAGINYYVPIVDLQIVTGDWTTNTNTNRVSTTPVVTLSSSGTFKTATSYGVTSTKPSGTDGTNYLTIDGSGSVTTTGVATSSWKATYYGDNVSITEAGLIENNLWAGPPTYQEGSQTVNITPTVTDNFAPLYIPIVSPSFSGGGLTPINYSGTPTITLATGSSTNMTNITVGAQNTSAYPYYFKVNASTAALSGATTVTRAAMTYTNGAGAIAAHSGTQALASGSSSPTVTVKAASNSTYVSLKKATMTVAGTNTVTPTASATGSQATLVSTNNSGVSITATGGGTASVTATATTNAAGYAPASTQLGSATLTASSNTTTDIKYLKEVKIVPPSSGTREFGIVVPNGSTTDFITFVFHVDSSGNVTIDNEYSLTY